MPDENRIFDVTRPKHVSPDATSKPVIVGHQPRVSDPMVRDNKPAPTRISINDGAIEEARGEPQAPATSAPAIIHAPEPREESRPMPQYDPVIPVNNPEAISKPILQDLPEPQPHDRDHIEGLHLSTPKRKRRLPKYLALLLVLIIAAYLILDSGLISTGINLPFHVFKQKNKPAASAANTTTPPASQNTATTATQSLPNGFKEYRIAGTNLTFAAPLAWGDPTSLTDPGFTKRGDNNQSDGTYAYLVNFATNKDVQIAVTSGKYLPSKRTPVYYDYLQWCTGTSDQNIYLSVLQYKTESKVDIPTTTTCDYGPLTGAQKIDNTTIVQPKATDSQKKVIGDIYIKNLNDPSLVVLRVKDAAMTNGDNIKQLLNTVQVDSASQ